MRGGRVELEEGWRNRNRRSRSQEKLLPTPADSKLEPLDSVKRPKIADKKNGGEDDHHGNKEGNENNVKEETDTLAAEDFSDFDVSDDEILNQEDDPKDDMRGSESPRPSSRGSLREGRKRRDGVLDGVLEAGQ